MSLESKYRYQKKKKEFTIFGFPPGILIFVCAFTFMMAWGFGKFRAGLDEPSNSSPTYDAFAAQYACKQFILERLKAPSSADFQPNQKLSISGSGTGPWTVNGYVDAQNSFGAKVRQFYSCTIEFSGNKSKLLSLNIN